MLQEQLELQRERLTALEAELESKVVENKKLNEQLDKVKESGLFEIDLDKLASGKETEEQQ
jgi:hypothetical protein